MNTWIETIQNHAQFAPLFLFVGALLAGLSIPISIDLLMIIAASLAATSALANPFHLFFAMLFGCILSAWIAYGIGRRLGPQLLKIPYFAKILTPKRMESAQKFFAKRGPFALVIGRFIPFGVRNCLYMSSGMSKMPFLRFALLDSLACMLWASTSFTLYFFLGKNIETIYRQVKMANFLLFIAFSVTVIGAIWYNKRKTSKEKNV